MAKTFLTEVQVEEIVSWGEKGKSGTWIATRMGIPPATVNWRLLSNGIDPWPGKSQEAVKNHRGRFSPEEDARMLELGLPGPQQRIVNSLATWSNIGHARPTKAQVAWLARYSPTSSAYTNPRGALNAAGLIEYPVPDCVSLTSAGGEVALPIDLGGTLLDFVLSQIPGPEQRILRSVAQRYPDALTNDDAAAGANYSPTSSAYTNPRGALKTKDLITYPSNGMVRAADWLFEASP